MSNLWRGGDFFRCKSILVLLSQICTESGESVPGVRGSWLQDWIFRGGLGFAGMCWEVNCLELIEMSRISYFQGSSGFFVRTAESLLLY